MPKLHSSTHNHHRYSTGPMPMAAGLSAPTSMSYYSSRNPVSGYYDLPPNQAPTAPMSVPPYDPYAVAPPPPLSIATNNGYSLPVPTRASSGAWSPEHDQTLIAARAQGMNWAAIQQNHFSDKTPNACRKRHERLMEKKGADDWDARKLEFMAKEYMAMRKEIWAPLAQRVGEKWNVVEQKCMSNGLKNLQSASRHATRRERMENGQPVGPYDDDSGVSGIDMTPVDEHEGMYSSPSSAGGNGGGGSGEGSTYDPVSHAVQHPGAYAPPAGYYSHHGYSTSVSSTATANYGAPGGPGGSGSPSPYLGHPNRMPSVDPYAQGAPAGSGSPSPYLGHPNRMSSVDMGIDALINPNPASGSAFKTAD